MTDDAALADIVELSWAEALVRSEARLGERVAFHFEGPGWHQSLSFGEWLDCSSRVAAALHALGVRTGDRVGVLAPGSAIWPILQTACSHIGAMIVPINIRYRSDELTFVLGLAEPKVVVLIGRYNNIDYLDLVRRSADKDPTMLVTVDRPEVELASTEPGVAPGDVRTWSDLLGLGASSPVPPITGRADNAVLLQFTSGTSDFPKGAMLNSRATLGATWYLAQRMQISERDVYFSTQPMYHVGGSVATTLMALGAAPTMIVPERYSPEAVFSLIPKFRCTARTGQAAMYAMELAHPDFRPDMFASLEKAWSGGTPELRRVISREMGVPVMTTIYGLTETAGTTTINALDDPEDVWMYSCGRPIPGVEVAISTEAGITHAPDVEGEIIVRGWSVMLGYYRNEQATREAIDGDGWLHTGDIGRLDASGNLYFVDRMKDMIKPGGENVSAAEVERVLQTFPGISEVTVVGQPDERLGEVPVAFVQMRPGSARDEKALIEHCASRMASFKVPRAVIFVDEWPMTESGKILKRELRSRLDRSPARFVGPSG